MGNDQSTTTTTREYDDLGRTTKEVVERTSNETEQKMIYTGVGAAAATLSLGVNWSSDNKNNGSDKDSDYDGSGKGKKR